MLMISSLITHTKSRFHQRAKGALHFIALFLVLGSLFGCSGAEDSMPVALPVPFSGSYTGDTNILVAEGTPTLGSQVASRMLSGKFQDSSSTGITWNLFKSQGALAGSFTLFPDTLSNLEVSPFSAGGVKRSYMVRVCADLTQGKQTCSNNFQCYELPTDYPPTFNASDVVPDDPGATAVVRKIACSGNNDSDGQLLDGRFLTGMVQGSNGDFVFYSQEDSAVYLHNFGFDGSGPPDSRVVSTVIYQGGDVHLPLPQDSLLLALNATPLLLPGSDAVVGSKVEAFKEFIPMSPDLIQVKTDVSLFIGNSTLQINNAVTSVHRIPEVEDAVRQLVATQFADDPSVTPELLEKGKVFFNTVAGTADPINCDPAANQARRGGEGRISAEGSRIEAWVLPPDEETIIARDAIGLLSE